MVCNKLVFAFEIVLFGAKQSSLPKCVVCSEVTFDAKIVLSTANQCLVLKLCCL
jgi:hypothetical protein